VWDKTADWVTAGSTVALVIVGVVSFWFVNKQLRISASVARYDLLLRLFEFVKVYNHIHVDLCAGGESWDPETRGEDYWHELQRYMGLLETLYGLVQDKLIDFDKVDTHYSHRIARITKNDPIREKLLDNRLEAVRWVEFNHLRERLKAKPVYVRLGGR